MDLENKPYSCRTWIGPVCSALVCAIALVVLVGWASGFLVLASLLPGMIPMNPAVAVSFLLLGLAVGWQALYSGTSHWKNWTVSAAGATVAIVAFLRLAAYLGTPNAHVDTLLFPSELNQVPFSPDRMAPCAAVGLLLGGIAVASVVWRKQVTRHIAGVAAIGVLLTGLYGFANYLFTIHNLRRRGLYMPTPMHTALALLLLPIGILALDRQLPVISRATGDSPGGILMRRLLPPLILLPILLGWLRIFAEYHLRLSGMAASNATLVMLQIVLLGALVWAASIMVDRLNDQRQQLLARLQKSQQELLAAKLAAEEATRVKSQFLANMSHEIRTPLHGVIAMMELLAETPLDEQQRGYAQVAKTSANALLAIITDILDFSKIEAGRLELDSVDFDLRSCTEDAVYLMLPAAMRKKLDMGYDMAPDIPSLVRGDPVRLRQVLMNLLSNAIKFTDQGEIWVKLSAQDITDNNFLVRFEVHDTGVGIAPEDVRKLFTAFAQVHHKGAKVYGGTGLGLTICRQIVELMGGKIDVESRLGDGSTFWFTIRLERRKAVWLDVDAIPEALRRQRVLLLMATPARRDKLDHQLQYWKMEVENTASVESCLDRLRAGMDRPFNVLFVEHRPPEFNALKISQVIHSLAGIRAPAIIALARADMHISREIQRNFGLSGVLSKPVRQSQLFDLLMQLVSTNGTEAGTSLPTEQSRLQLPPGQHGLNVLVAEDNEINQFVIREVLSGLKLQCHIVSDGQQCIEVLKQQRYALILMDCLMPVMDGFETAKNIRALESTGSVFSSLGRSRIPIVALTANATGLDRQNSMEAGMDGFLTKPLDRRQLVELITKLVHTAPGEPDAGSTVPVEAGGIADEKAAAAAPFELSRLHSYFAQDLAMVDRLLGQFIGQGTQQIAKLGESMEKSDWEAATRGAHAIKGTAACLFAEALYQAAKELEVICRSRGDTSRAMAAWLKVQEEMKRCIDYLRNRQESSDNSITGKGV